MKKLLLILVLLLLLAGGAGAAWWFYFRRPDNAPPPPPTLTKTDVGPLTVSVIKNNRVARVFFIKLAVIYDSSSKQDKVEHILPRLIDGYNVELHELMSRKLMEESDYNTDVIITRLQEVSDRLMGKGTVTQISISAIDRQEFK